VTATTLVVCVKKLFDEIFMHCGHVLGFDRTFAEFSNNEIGIDSDDPAYRIKGASKGDQLWTLFGLADDVTLMRAISAMWDYEQWLTSRTTDSEELK